MKVLAALDSFKGSLTSCQAGEAVRLGILRAIPAASVSVVPIADGGEGTTEALTEGLGGQYANVTVSDPLGRPITARYGLIQDGKTAVMEIASAAGLTLLCESERNPLHTTTFGVGQMISHALDNGCRHFLIGIGGSATNDGGVGMLQALGFAFEDKDGNDIPVGAEGLENIAKIDLSGAKEELKDCSFRIACDVKNPLCGENGCSAVFAPQKGADAAMVAIMDASLDHYAKMTAEVLSHADATAAGAGAAGGLGFAFASFLSAELTSGIDIIMEEIGLEDKIKAADIVIVGEGKLDGQSSMGKAPVGIARLAQKHHKPVIALAGCVGRDVSSVAGINACFSILNEPLPLAEAMKEDIAAYNLESAAEQVFRLIDCFEGK